MPAGFYYKTFMWPKSLWRRYEHYIRKASGLGTAPTEADPDRYDRMNAHCDVLVVGGGPAGLAAAWAAGSAGARVMLVDEQSEFGGSLLSQRDVASVTADPASDWLDRRRESDGVGHAHRRAARDDARVRLLPRSTVFGYHDQNFLTIAERLTDHLPRRSARGRASACGACARSRWCSRRARWSGRSSSRTTIAPA
jgi:sarcosine oxidase subunit alpha